MCSHSSDRDNYSFTFTVVQFGTYPVYRVTQGTKSRMVVPNIRGSSLHDCHSSGTWNFEVVARFLENLCTLNFMTEEYCVVENAQAFGEKTCCLLIF